MSGQGANGGFRNSGYLIFIRVVIIRESYAIWGIYFRGPFCSVKP